MMLAIDPIKKKNKTWHLNLFITGNHIEKTYFFYRTDLLFERGKKVGEYLSKRINDIYFSLLFSTVDIART